MADVTLGLYDTVSGETLTIIPEGATVSTSTFTDTTQLLVELNAAGTLVGRVKSVTFTLTDGTNTYTGFDNNIPYTQFDPSFLPPGDYELTVAAYSKPAGKGTLLGTHTFTFTVNAAPDAADDSATTDEGAAIVVDVLGNDTDGEGDALTVGSVSQGANGTVTINPDGTLTYTPDAGFSGSDSFTYTVSDGNGGTSTATVEVTVNAQNDPPVAAADGYTLDEDGVLSVSALSGVLANDTDPEGDALSVTLVSDVSNGTLVLNPDGSFSYTPDADYNGTDSFTYQVSDGNGGTSTATVGLTVNPVNDAPVASDDGYVLDEDGVLSVSAAGGVLANDSDLEGDALSVTLVSDVSHGALTLNPDGSFSYTPDADYNGSDSFTYQVSDGNGGTNTATVTFTVNPVNDAPAAADDAGFTTPLETALEIPADALLANDSDIDGDALTVTGVGGAVGGTVGLVAGVITFTPTPGYSGPASFTYDISDGNGGTSTATVSLDVGANGDPVAAADSYSVDEDGALSVPAAGGVLANDTDAEGDALSVTLVSDVSHGTLVLNPDGSFSYTPDANYSGSDSFTYEVSDGNGGTSTATVGLTVNPVNDAPVAAADGYTLDEDGALSIPAAGGVLANDSDLEGDALSVTLVSDVSHGALTLNPDGSFSYMPDADYNGSDSFTYEVSDGNGGTNTATVTLTVNPVNDAPAAADDGYTLDEDSALTAAVLSGVLANDTDADGDGLSVTLVSDVSNGALVLNADGSFSYTPDADYSGTDSFIYEVSDGSGGTDTATVTFTVNSVNDAPVAAGDSYVLDEDGVLSVSAPSGVLANDSDTEGESLGVSLVSDASNGTLVLNADGSFTYTADADYSGSDSFVYQVSDGNGGTDTATVTLTVNPVNDAPVAAGDSYTVNKDNVLSVTAAAGVLANDTDVEGDTLTVAVLGDVSHGTLVLNPDGSFSYTPDAGYSGSDSFTYQVSDGNGGTSTATVDLTVESPVEEPTFVSVTFRQGANGYDGVVDTGIREQSPSQTYDSAVTLRVDAGTGSDIEALVSFSDLFGSEPGQIPVDATIVSASLTMEVTNGSFNGGTVHRMLTDWDGSATWNSMGNGVQTDGIEAVATADATLGRVAIGSYTIDVTTSLQAWSDAGTTSTEQNAANNGWLFTTPSTDAWDFGSSEGASSPLLTVTYTLDGSAPPSSAPTVSLTSVTPNPQTEGSGATMSFTLSLDQPSTQSVTINYSTVDGTAQAGSDFVGVNGGSVTFLPGETEKTIEIDLLDDSLVESPESFSIQINSATNSWIGTASANGNILDDDGNYTPAPPIQASMVQVIDLTSAPFRAVDDTGYGSGDPSGLAYVPELDKLFIVDSEHNESPYNSSTNMFSITPDGTVEAYDLTGFTNEPTGIAYNSDNGYLYISDDDQQEIFWVDPSNPSVALGSFDTASAGLRDTEDSIYDPATGHLFVLDGSLKVIVEFSVTGEVVNYIALPPVMTDAEAMAYDSEHDIFFVASGADTTIWAIDRNGEIVDTIDLLADPAYDNPTTGVDPVIKGMELAPSSDPNDGDTMSLYVADYGVDQQNDGRLFEIDLGWDTPLV